MFWASGLRLLGHEWIEECSARGVSHVSLPQLGIDVAVVSFHEGSDGAPPDPTVMW